MGDGSLGVEQGRCLDREIVVRTARLDGYTLGVEDTTDSPGCSSPRPELGDMLTTAAVAARSP